MTWGKPHVFAAGEKVPSVIMIQMTPSHVSEKQIMYNMSQLETGSSCQFEYHIHNKPSKQTGDSLSRKVLKQARALSLGKNLKQVESCELQL